MHLNKLWQTLRQPEQEQGQTSCYVVEQAQVTYSISIQKVSNINSTLTSVSEDTAFFFFYSPTKVRQKCTYLFNIIRKKHILHIRAYWVFSGFKSNLRIKKQQQIILSNDPCIKCLILQCAYSVNCMYTASKTLLKTMV